MQAKKYVFVAVSSACLAWGTFLTTSLVKGSHFLAAKPAGDPPKVSVTTTAVPAGQVVAVQPKRFPGFISSAGMSDCKVSSDGTLIRVQANVYLNSIRTQDSYMWMVRIVESDEKHKEVYRKIYDDQIFPLGVEGEASPTFDDTFDIPLPAGKYIVETSVYTIKPGIGMDGLNDPDTLFSLQKPRGCREVNITVSRQKKKTR